MLTPAQTEMATVHHDTIYLREQNRDLEAQISDQKKKNQDLRTEMSELKAVSSDQIQDAAARVQEAERKVREGETERRKLHNTIQELKGNIRVFCRVRPPSGQSDSGPNILPF